MANARIVIMKFETAAAAERFIGHLLDVSEDAIRANTSVAFLTSRSTNDLINEVHDDGFEYGLDYSFSLSTT
jgi:hypothetical protein|tara:strand:+ start:594 stop:809 length:216 start_codon:yes stop_codon:yes gene_type:complete